MLMKKHLLVILFSAALFVQCRSNGPRVVTDTLPAAPSYCDNIASSIVHYLETTKY